MELIKDILAGKGREVRTVRPENTVRTALETMAQANVGALMVTTADGSLVGIFSERDLARRAIVHGGEIFDLPVKEFMSTTVRSVREGTTIDTCMALMTAERIRHLPVVESGRLVGVVSIGDVVKAMVDERDLVIDQLEHYIASSL